MKNKIFTTAVVLVSIFLAILWSREHNHNRQVRQYRRIVTRIEFRVHVLRLKVEALKSAMEMLDLSRSVQLSRRENKKNEVTINN